MNFLELVQRTFNVCAIEGTPPANVQGQTGMNYRCVNWVKDAYADIVSEHADWFFLEDYFSFETIPSNATYSPTSVGLESLSKYKIYSSTDKISGVRIYNEVSDESDLTFIPYDVFYKNYFIGSYRTQEERPNVFTVGPQNEMMLWPVPNDIYTVNGKYFFVPDELTVNDDVPIIPAMYHMAIVYRAKMFYGGFEESSSVYSEAESDYVKKLHQLETNQLQQFRQGSPLA